MKRRPKPLVPTENLVADADAILQVKFWLTGISPMVWWRVLAPSSFALRELHGMIQVAMGWEGIHLYDFQLRAAHYGSWEVAAASPDVTLAALRFRKGARFIYQYDLNAVVTRSGRRCASRSAASNAASSPCFCRIPETSACAAGSVNWSNRRCRVAAVVSA